MKRLFTSKLAIVLVTVVMLTGAIAVGLASHTLGESHAAASDSSQTLAKSILSNSNIQLATSHAGPCENPKPPHQKISCTDDATAYENIVQLSNGQKAAKSSYYNPPEGHAGLGGSTTVQPLVLQIILALGANGHKVTVSEIAGGVHANHSAHYTGRAVDFSSFDNQSLKGRNAPSLAALKIILPLLPPGSAIGQSQCPVSGGKTSPLPKGVTAFSDTCNHLHIQTLFASSYTGTGHNITYNATGSLTLSSITEDQQGNISGQVTWGSPLVGSGPFTGTVKADKTITFTSTANDGTGFVITLTGTVDTTNHTLSGTYTVNSGAQTGTWQVS